MQPRSGEPSISNVRFPPFLPLGSCLLWVECALVTEPDYKRDAGILGWYGLRFDLNAVYIPSRHRNQAHPELSVRCNCIPCDEAILKWRYSCELRHVREQKTGR